MKSCPFMYSGSLIYIEFYKTSWTYSRQGLFHQKLLGPIIIIYVKNTMFVLCNPRNFQRKCAKFSGCKWSTCGLSELTLDDETLSSHILSTSIPATNHKQGWMITQTSKTKFAMQKYSYIVRVKWGSHFISLRHLFKSTAALRGHKNVHFSWCASTVAQCILINRPTKKSYY